MIKIILGGLAAVFLLASVAMWMLRPASQRLEGSVAPDFELPDQNGQAHRLSDYAGRWLVLFFYPRDDTPGCTLEACRFRDEIGVLGNLHAAVMGISVDSIGAHAEFARQHQLPFPLLSDPGGHTASVYGSLLNLGIARFARRNTFIIAPDGRIAARFDKVDPASHAREVAGVLRTLRQHEAVSN